VPSVLLARKADAGQTALQRLAGKRIEGRARPSWLAGLLPEASSRRSGPAGK
jgi:hypothetical protein